ncbi:hypothetical protein KOR34_35770 [Posidoniimonas corsicana]|uniref:PilZ domain-containing protein n=1 Tax=Posidoniimonas corsicana TaxID=1938618 RepID=A0A5C5V5C8_9BACT|nr:hypothetical protein KOR34_35770 [Posidoniimonas corsicana]
MAPIDSQALPSDPTWDQVVACVDLPAKPNGPPPATGAVAEAADSKRAHPRTSLPAWGILRHNKQLFGAYLCDVSRSGLGFYSPVALIPPATVEIWLPNGSRLEVVVKRCIRHAKDRYRCGAVHVGHADS